MTGATCVDGKKLEDQEEIERLLFNGCHSITLQLSTYMKAFTIFF